MANYNEAQQLLQQLKPIINQCIESHSLVKKSMKADKAVVWAKPDTTLKTVQVKLLGDLFNPDIQPLTIDYNARMEGFLINATPQETTVWVWYNYSLSNGIVLYDGAMSIGG